MRYLIVSRPLSSKPLISRILSRTVVFADGLFTYHGSDTPEVSSDGRPSENFFYDNAISDTKTSVKIKEANKTVITGELRLD